MGKATYRVYCLAAPYLSLAIDSGKVVLAKADSSDPTQKWYKEDWSSVKDESGISSFALVNIHTGQAIQHPYQTHESVRLVKYEANSLNESVLWTIHDPSGDGGAIREAKDITLNLDAFRTVDENGFVHYGLTVGVWEWHGGGNQRWRIDAL